MSEFKRPFVIAVLGAESTGKTTLAQALTRQLTQDWGLRTTCVPEWLRLWCEEQGRTPRPDEQRNIAQAQLHLMESAALSSDVIICDTTPIMTAVYSQLLFQDRSLDAMAVEAHRRVHLTLLTGLDLPWVADGHQRDGPHVREPVDSAIRQLLASHQLDWLEVTGLGPERLACAMAHAAPLLKPHPIS